MRKDSGGFPGPNSTSGAPQGGPIAPDRPTSAVAELSWAAAPTLETLWGVYGPDCFPTIFACQLRDYFWNERAVWGFSIFKNKPGFRTLGVGLVWATEHNLRLFPTREAAFAHVSSLFPEPL